jgi:hypothetical protein
VAIPRVQQYKRWYHLVFREKNEESFAGRKSVVVDLKSFNTLFYYATSLGFPYLLSFHDFIDYFFLSS